MSPGRPKPREGFDLIPRNPDVPQRAIIQHLPCGAVPPVFPVAAQRRPDAAQRRRRRRVLLRRCARRFRSPRVALPNGREARVHRFAGRGKPGENRRDDPADAGGESRSRAPHRLVGASDRGAKDGVGYLVCERHRSLPKAVGRREPEAFVLPERSAGGKDGYGCNGAPASPAAGRRPQTGSTARAKT
jgi:hypothetical protein